MPPAVSDRLRAQVARRARYRCEYCGLPERFAGHRHEVDHVVPRQHGGVTDLANLAFACLRCNRCKGPNVGSYDDENGDLVPLFHPRSQTWSDHFRRSGSLIVPLTAVGRVTVRVLHLNSVERLAERGLLDIT